MHAKEKISYMYSMRDTGDDAFGTTHNSVKHKKGRSLLRVKKMTLKFSFKKYLLNPKLNITFTPNMSTGCGNTSIRV